MAKIRQTIDTSEADRAFVREFEDQADMLAGMVLEAVVENPAWLLSPHMRRSLADKARQVLSLLRPLKDRLCVDNPCEDLKPWKERP